MREPPKARRGRGLPAAGRDAGAQLLQLTGQAGDVRIVGGSAVTEQVRQLVGDEGASLLQTVSRNAGTTHSNIVSMSVGFVLMLLGAVEPMAHGDAVVGQAIAELFVTFGLWVVLVI